MKYLIDTDVLSLLRRPERQPILREFFKTIPKGRLFISVITVGEIELGIARQKSVDPVFADHLSNWLSDTLAGFRGKVLPVTRQIAGEWGRLGARLGHRSVDLMIAATAIVEGCTVITRNVKHFEPTGVPIIDPLEAPSSTVQ